MTKTIRLVGQVLASAALGASIGAAIGITAACIFYVKRGQRVVIFDWFKGTAALPETLGPGFHFRGLNQIAVFFDIETHAYPFTITLKKGTVKFQGLILYHPRVEQLKKIFVYFGVNYHTKLLKVILEVIKEEFEELDSTSNSDSADEEAKKIVSDETKAKIKEKALEYEIVVEQVYIKNVSDGSEFIKVTSKKEREAEALKAKHEAFYFPDE